MLTPVRSSRFKRDVRKAKARGKDLAKLRSLLGSLIKHEKRRVGIVTIDCKGAGRATARHIWNRTGSSSIASMVMNYSWPARAPIQTYSTNKSTRK